MAMLVQPDGLMVLNMEDHYLGMDQYLWKYHLLVGSSINPSYFGIH